MESGGPDYLMAQGRRLEFLHLPAPDAGVPTLVLLHEGLGSLSMWRDLPRQLSARTRFGLLVYSREGYGNSQVLSGPRHSSYLQHEALAVLPDVLGQLGISDPVLVGHSDGGSIALIHAAHRPVRGVVVLAPHLFAEEMTLLGAHAVRRDYRHGVLKRLLSRYHLDPDATFYGWNDAWLSPAFRAFDIRHLLGKITAPVLAIQGRDDPHGTMIHIREIADRAANVQLLELSNCGHSPHIDQRMTVLQAISVFCRRLRGSAARGMDVARDAIPASLHEASRN